MKILHSSLSLLCLLLLSSSMCTNATKQQTECSKFIQKFLSNIKTGNLTNIPTIIYSGVTTNNPGQMKQCIDVENYSYFLIYFNNVTDKFRTYTGACLPNVCNETTLQMALAEYNVTVKGYSSQPQIDGLAITGVVVVGLWIAVVAVWSCVVSFKEEEVKKLAKKDDKQRESINSQLEQPILQPVEQVVPDFKLFIFYEGYQQLFKAPSKISIFSPILFLSVLSYLISTQFSYRLSIAQNQQTSALKFLNSIWGVLACNTEIALHTLMFVLGLRLAYSAYRINSFKEIVRFYFDQVLKKWVLFVFMTLMIYAFVTVFTSEPLNNVWSNRNGDDCPKKMWQMWLLFRNFLGDCQACLPWMSIIASDIFFTLVSTPFILVHKSNKKLGYVLFSLLIFLSFIVSYSILDSHNIKFEPYKLMNGQKQFTLDYQANTFVRMGAYYFGLIFGLLIVEGLEKTQSLRTKEALIAKTVRREKKVQIGLHLLGLAVMVVNYLVIIPYLDEANQNKQPYAYLMLSPFFFIVGLALFVLPSFWQGQSDLTRLINKVLGWKKWVHLDRISLTYFMIGPMIMAYSNYSMQSSIFYDFPTVWTYTIGDLCIAYVATLLVASAFEQQFNAISIWLQYKVYGNESKYSVLVIEQQE